MKNFNWDRFWALVIKIVFGLAILAFFLFYIYILVTYGDKPITDVPTWVWWLLHG